LKITKFRTSWERVHKTYERKAYKIFKAYFSNEAKNIPWNYLTEDNYKSVVAGSVKIYKLYNAYYDVYNQIGLIHGNRIGKAINKELKEFNPIAFESAYQRELYDWIMKNSGNRIVSVHSGYIKYIQQLLAQGVMEGRTMRETAIEIERLVNKPNFYRWQAQRIARTESTASANRGAIYSGNTSGVLLDKIWISGKDGRVRTRPPSRFDHREMNGKKVERDGFFNVDGELIEYPGALVTKNGDKSSGANVINCRCAVALVPRRDKNGRLIRTSSSPPPPRVLRKPIITAPRVVQQPRVFQPALSLKEAEERFLRFAPRVDFKGLPLDKQNEILNGIEDVLGKYKVTLKSDIGFQTKRIGSWGTAGYRIENGQPSNPQYIRIQKTYAKNSEKLSKENIDNFKRSKDTRLTTWERYSGMSESRGMDKNVYIEKINILKSTERWTIHGDRALYSTTVHESFHAVDYYYNARKVFAEQLKKYNITRNDWYKVSEYGGSQLGELWAEVGTAYQTNTRIPEAFIKAFTDTLKIVGAI